MSIQNTTVEALHALIGSDRESNSRLLYMATVHPAATSSAEPRGVPLPGYFNLYSNMIFKLISKQFIKWD